MHTAMCLAYQAELESARAAWWLRWPSACKKCEGAGCFLLAATQWEPPDVDLCDCLESGVCPRCGAMLEISDDDVFEVEDTCPVCGWSIGCEDQACPYPFEGCDCGERLEPPLWDEKSWSTAYNPYNPDPDDFDWPD